MHMGFRPVPVHLLQMSGQPNGSYNLSYENETELFLCHCIFEDDML